MSTLPHQKYLLSKDSTIQDALAVITENQRGAVLIVGEKDVLVGVVADGDIRRALVKGATVMTPIEKIVNFNVISVSKKEIKKSEKIFSEHHAINLIPVLDSSNRVLDVLVRA